MKVKSYRIFLVVLMVAILLFAAGLCFFLMEQTEKHPDGVLVQGVSGYERTV